MSFDTLLNKNYNKKITSAKNECMEKEMKEYAETAMNELLGWYGYDKMNSKETQALNLTVFSKRNGETSKASSSISDDSSEYEKSAPSPGRREEVISPFNSNEGYDTCGWCQKIGNCSIFTFKMSNGDKVFCSEVCFTHYRRANFKKSKTCDWCKHVRHTVNYVDLQDGDVQYQFCSDKCLNQFKLDIFCQETKEHFEIHPHHRDQIDKENTSLITPDLWLRNCNSPTNSESRCSSPINVTSPLVERLEVTLEPPSSLPYVEESAPKKSNKRSESLKRNKRLRKCPQKPLDAAPLNGLRAGTSLCSDFRPHTHDLRQRPPPPFGSLPPHPLQLRSPFPIRNGPISNQIPPLLPIGQPLHHRPPLQTPPVNTAPTAPNQFRPFLPPPLLLVPHPVPIPIPIPIPIPLPILIPIKQKEKEKDKEDVLEKDKCPTAEKPRISDEQSDEVIVTRNRRKRKREENADKSPKQNSVEV